MTILNSSGLKAKVISEEIINHGLSATSLDKLAGSADSAVSTGTVRVIDFIFKHGSGLDRALSIDTMIWGVLLVGLAVGCYYFVAYYALSHWRAPSSSSQTIPKMHDAPAALLTHELTDAETLELAVKYRGLYASVRRMVLPNGRYRIAPMGDWVERTRNLTIAKSIKDRWLSQLENFEQFENETGKRKAEWLQQEIMKLGIQWDTKTALLGDDITAHRYEMADGTPPTPGVTLRVIQPCCFIGSVILEKGIVEAMDKGVR